MRSSNPHQCSQAARAPPRCLISSPLLLFPIFWVYPSLTDRLQFSVLPLSLPCARYQSASPTALSLSQLFYRKYQFLFRGSELLKGLAPLQLSSLGTNATCFSVVSHLPSAFSPQPASVPRSSKADMETKPLLFLGPQPSMVT